MVVVRFVQTGATIRSCLQRVQNGSLNPRLTSIPLCLKFTPSKPPDFWSSQS